MELTISTVKTETGITHTISMPGPRIVDVQWPQFTVEWMGRRIPCKHLGGDLYQIGKKLWFRDRNHDDLVEINLLDLLKEQP